MTGTFYHILLPIAVEAPFTYRGPSGLQSGQLVKVPFKRGEKVGVVWGEEAQPSLAASKIKTITSVLETAFTPAHQPFISFAARYYMQPLGLVLRQLLSGFSEEVPKERSTPQAPQAHHAALNPQQQQAADTLVHAVKAKAYQPFLLQGVTGSGKTEVYVQAAKQALSQGQQALILLPEIALTPQILNRFEQRLGVTCHAWHANVSPGPKARVWQRAAAGEPLVVIGARSALFLPYAQLGVIVVDEEHDQSYKQEEQLLYNARDLAVVRASYEQRPVVLASATPSLESLHNAQQGKYTLLQLPSRYGQAVMPHITLVDRTDVKNAAKHGKWLSKPLIEAVYDTLAKHQQVILFLNRRGYAPVTLCEACGHRVECPHCSTALVFHKGAHHMLCHHCGFQQPASATCTACKCEDTLIPCGPGVEQLEDEVIKFFPNARRLVLSSDIINSPKRLHEALAAIKNRDVDIILGTQLIAKGHHFPHVTLVGIVDADSGFLSPHPRAAEHTFQLLQQIAGRAGREAALGKVLVQTYNAQAKVMKALAEHDAAGFMELEMQMRQAAALPPFGHLAAVIVSCRDEAKGHAFVQQLHKVRPKASKVQVHGPAPAPLFKLRNDYRWRFLVQAPKGVSLQRYIEAWLKAPPTTPPHIKITTDMDPYSFY